MIPVLGPVAQDINLIFWASCLMCSFFSLYLYSHFRHKSFLFYAAFLSVKFLYVIRFSPLKALPEVLQPKPEALFAVTEVSLGYLILVVQFLFFSDLVGLKQKQTKLFEQLKSILLLLGLLPVIDLIGHLIGGGTLFSQHLEILFYGCFAVFICGFLYLLVSRYTHILPAHLIRGFTLVVIGAIGLMAFNILGKLPVFTQPVRLEMAQYKWGPMLFVCGAEIIAFTLGSILIAKNLYESRFTSKHYYLKQHSDSFPDENFVQQLTDVLEGSFQNPQFTVDALASNLGMSRTGLFNKTKAVFQDTPANILRNYRLGRAREMLLSNRAKVSISEIAYESGFSSPNHFSRTFKKAFDVTPTQFLQRPHISVPIKESLN